MSPTLIKAIFTGIMLFTGYRVGEYVWVRGFYAGYVAAFRDSEAKRKPGVPMIDGIPIVIVGPPQQERDYVKRQ